MALAATLVSSPLRPTAFPFGLPGLSRGFPCGFELVHNRFDFSFDLAFACVVIGFKFLARYGAALGAEV